MSRDSQPVVDGMELVVEQNVGDLKHAGYHATTLPILKELDERNFKSWTRFVVSHDEVIGVTINGESRAYPIRYLRWHEIVNDTIGGAPVAVTYNPLCDSSVVFDRRLNGITLNFGFSGLLYNSNLVMYDRDSMSLFCQLKAAAIAGPLAGQSLTVLPLWYGTWKDWSEQHPDTSVFTGNNIYKERYYRDPLPDYYDKGELRFPVAPLPPPGGRALMDIVQSPTMRARWFAWYALRGDKIE
ncbi:MAG: DUF3179 domain-containing protein [Planctomycetes bacterium]|nr:DUF3179 domain-containing protein [Planctomycetota bacterium]